MKLNDSKIHLVVGEKGSGKTTLAAYITKKYENECIVFSNVPIEGAHKIEIDDLRKCRLPKNSIVLIDEAAAEINCRDWRQTGTEMLKLLQQVRHFESTLFWFSQSITALDIQVTDLCDDAIKCCKLPFGFSEYRIATKRFSKRGHAVFESTRKRFIVYRKKYYSYFDTHYIDSVLQERSEIKIERW